MHNDVHLHTCFFKICELNTEHEIVFVLISVDSQGDICNTGVISGSQNTEIIKQTDVLLWKI